MKKMEFQLPYYKVDVMLLQIESEKDENDVAELLKSIDAEDPGYTLKGIRLGAVNGGDTYSDLNNKLIVVLFYPMEDNAHRAEIYSHEKRHIEDRVLKFFGVNDIESAGLLAGFLGEKFYKFWNMVTNVETACENIFPEVKESEDEKIRKALISILKSDFEKDTTIFGISVGQIIDWLGKQSNEPNWRHHKVDLSNCSEEYRKAYYDGWNNCNMQHSQCESEKNDVLKCLINGLKFYYDDNHEATWGTDKWSMPVKHIIDVLESINEEKVD